ncbi:N-acyl homoserine lactonase family protein [Cytophagales bacterium WSM2-2]|nr:N-acyl homoserine lactonase family protein [Cytophagales bacterium WSM2-2]
MKNLLTNEIQTAVFTSYGKTVKVHAVQTGLISVKENFLNRKGIGIMSKLNIVVSNTYASFMPIWTWVIEHPEGIMVLDTGDIEESRYQDFYKGETFGTRLTLKAMSNIRKISKEDELDTQLLRLGIRAEQVSKVVLTHLHGDHTDGLKFFQKNEVILNEAEHKKPYGNLPTTYPKWFHPTLVNFSKDRVDFFDSAFPLTKAEDLLLVPTPGHTYHHSSILLRTDQEHILFAGDVSYKHQQLLDNQYAGSNIDFVQSQKTYDKIKQYAKRHSLIYLPSHDENSGNRLVRREHLYKSTQNEVVAAL